MQGVTKFKDGLKAFIKKEPFYLWLLIFIILINLTAFLSDLGKGAKPEELPKEPSKAKELIKKRAELGSVIIKDERLSAIASLVTIGVALFIFIGLLLDFALFIRKSEEDILERSHSPPDIRWDIWDGLKVIILFLFFGYVIVIIESGLAVLAPFLKTNKTIVSIANATIMDFIGIAIVFYFAIHCYKHNIKDLGLSFKKFFKNIYYGILGYISVIPTLVATLLITFFFVNVFKYQPEPQPVLELFLKEEKAGILVYLSIFVAVAGPIMEEIFFRGFLYNAIKKEADIRWAIIISALLFSFLHAHPVGFLPILVLGIFLAYLYEKTGSLISSITVHIIHNLIMVFFVFLIKGIRF